MGNCFTDLKEEKTVQNEHHPRKRAMDNKIHSQSANPAFAGDGSGQAVNGSAYFGAEKNLDQEGRHAAQQQPSTGWSGFTAGSLAAFVKQINEHGDNQQGQKQVNGDRPPGQVGGDYYGAEP